MRYFPVSTLAVWCLISKHSFASRDDPSPLIDHDNNERRLRYRPSQQNENNVATNSNAVLDDPCNRPNPSPGGAGPVGVLYVVSGTNDFAEKAFLPVVDYLRTTLNIPDASMRGPDEPKWAIATNPHLCRGILKDVIPFFDVVMTDFNVPIPNPNEFEEEERNRRRRRLALGYWRDYVSKTGADNKRYVKGFKVTAINNAPFEKTIFLDVDSVPCVPNFQERLVKALGAADIALTPEKRAGYYYSENHPKHWENQGDTNQHNSACVVLNMNSRNTRELLATWRENYFSLSVNRDQPSLGVAMKIMWYRNSLNHVDLKPNQFGRGETSKRNDKDRCTSGKYIVVHKPF